MVETLNEYKGALEELTNDDLGSVSVNDIRRSLENIATYEDTIAELRERIEEIRDEEQGKLDNMPDSFRDSERGERQGEVCGYLDDAVDESDLYDEDENMQDLISAVENIVENLENAAE